MATQIRPGRIKVTSKPAPTATVMANDGFLAIGSTSEMARRIAPTRMRTPAIGELTSSLPEKMITKPVTAAATPITPMVRAVPLRGLGLATPAL